MCKPRGRRYGNLCIMNAKPNAADPCPKCKGPLVVRDGMFYWRGRSMSGLVCVPCNALWDNPGDSFEAHVIETSRSNSTSARKEDDHGS